MNHRIISIAMLILSSLLTACASHPLLDPIATTYPKNKKTEVKKIMLLPVPIIANLGATLTGGRSKDSMKENIEYSPGNPSLIISHKESIIGDTAEMEFWITPNNSREFREKNLIARLKEGGKEVCGDDFRLKDTRYYYGTEAALNFRGIKTPALKAVYRCRAERVALEDPNFRAVEKHAYIFKDHKYFDISSFLILQSPKIVSEAVHSVIKNRKLNIIQNTTNLTSYIIIASSSQYEIHDRVPEHLVLIINGSKEESTVTMMHMQYQATAHTRGVNAAGTRRPGFPREAQPVARDVAFDYSRMLAMQILELAGK